MKFSIALTGWLCVAISMSSLSCAGEPKVKPKKEGVPAPTVVKTEKEWKAQLTPIQYHILREKGTERAFTGKLLKIKKPGLYHCAGCNTVLFDSKTKFDSGTGWPSFYDTVSKKNVADVVDTSHGMVREESICTTCGGHLGHVFNDGPKPTGLRYCINSAALTFEPKKEGVGEKNKETNDSE